MRRLPTPGVPVSRSEPPVASAPKVAWARIEGMAVTAPVPVSARSRWIIAPTSAPAEGDQASSTQGTRTGEPVDPGPTSSPSSSRAGPMANSTALRAGRAVPPTSRASSPSQASRASSSLTTAVSQSTRALRPRSGRSASGKAGRSVTSVRPRMPASPEMCRRASSVRSSEESCWRSRPTMNSKTSAPSSSGESTDRVGEVGVVEPGSCRSRRVRAKSTLSPGTRVGMPTRARAPPRCACPLTGGSSVKVASTPNSIRASRWPRKSHFGRPAPAVRESVPVRGTWKIGTWTLTLAQGASSPVAYSAATPIRTAPGTGSSTAYTTRSGSVSRKSGTHCWPSTWCSSGGPRTSSTKSTSAWRWPSSARTVLRPLGLLVDPPIGSPNQAAFAALGPTMPKARARLPKAPSPSWVIVMESAPHPGEVVA